MTDLELTKCCAKVMNCEHLLSAHPYIAYDPLKDDAQAFALDEYIVKAGYSIYMDKNRCGIEKRGYVWRTTLDMTLPENRRRVRVEAVSKIYDTR